MSPAWKTPAVVIIGSSLMALTGFVLIVWAVNHYVIANVPWGAQ